ncbi:MAG: FtsX-like permease family protein [Gemmatimonadota bacterium]|nr:FtsX-like permease family protein [Gemmatimonadota bacterium]
MNLRFVAAMVRRESRGATRRLGLHTLSVAVGVGALVAINSFRANLIDSVRTQARSILGADLELRRNQPFPDSVRAAIDSAVGAGSRASYRTSFASMALAPATGQARLIQAVAITPGFPYYGTVETQPAGLWSSLGDDRHVLVDPAVLIQLGVTVGDSLRVGDVTFAILGAVTAYPGRVSLQSAIGPRVYFPMAWLEATNLIRRGSRAFYTASLAMPTAADVRRFLYYNDALLDSARVRNETVDETEDDLTEAFDTLARFLGLVGLAALLLGGIGVASAVHAYVRSRLDSVAVLRCLGASSGTVMAIYLSQALLVGVTGAGLGTVLGLGVQASLPRVLRQFLPLDVVVRPHLPAILEGFALGTIAALVFALLPLLPVRAVPPLRAIRRDLEPGGGRRDPWRFVVAAGLAALAVGLSLWQAPEPRIGLGFAAGIGVTILGLWLAARALIAGMRRFFPQRARYAVRQGVANLFRPRNQTLAVTLALGFGVFLISLLYVVQYTLLDQFRIDARTDRPNLVLFDIQTDQRDGVRDVLQGYGFPILQETPIVPARIAALNDSTVDQILAAPGAYQRERWALRREYRNTYRDTVVGSETVTAGEWWGTGGQRGGRAEGQRGRAAETVDSSAVPPFRRSADSIPRISVEEDLAADLAVGLGDRITWNVQGVLMETRITSLRRVDWARFEPNFFVVFEPGVLEDAPQMAVILTRSADVTARARVQRDVVERFANVAVVDLTLFQQTLDDVIGKVTLAIRFMALFSVASGILILVGALATSRRQRLREVTLLRTLGARSPEIRTVLLTEYASLGLLAGITGTLLSTLGGWAAAAFVFEVPFRLPLGALAIFWGGSALLTTVIGAATGRELSRRPPLDVLRALAE